MLLCLELGKFFLPGLFGRQKANYILVEPATSSTTQYGLIYFVLVVQFIHKPTRHSVSLELV